jgi:glycosyltransferase involved in cell wall biosynthesis
MKVLALTRYGRLGASSRIRFLQYLPWLAAASIDVTVSALFTDEYVLGLQRDRRDGREVMRSYRRRLSGLVGARGFDLLWIEKELFPWLPVSAERALLPRGLPYVLDYDDAVFHAYDRHRNPAVRWALGGKHPSSMRRAALVVAGNEYLADFAATAGAREVAIVPTAIDLGRYGPPGGELPARNGALPRVGWIGQRATAGFLRPLAPLLERLARSGKARFTAIGIDPQALGLPMDGVAWTEEGEVQTIRSLDVGIMPLADGPFERGKCGYKLIQYMACGLPVIASPVGVNRILVEHGVNGFLAATPRDWEVAIETLLADPALRRRMGEAGRRKVEQGYSVQVTAPKLAELLRRAAGPRATVG